MFATTYHVEEEFVAGVAGGGIESGAVTHLVVPFPVQVIRHHTDEIQEPYEMKQPTSY